MFRLNFASTLAAMMLAYATGTSAANDPQSRAPLLEGLGDHHHEVTTDSPEAQRYFDQGLVLAFGFNHGEAHRSFMQAARIDPDCAMCWWGAAWVLGPNINVAMDPERVPDAWELLEKAKSAAEHVTEREHAYIEALAKRYQPEPMEDRSALDKAFAEAMGEVARAYPDDLDAQVIHAEALMDTTPWDYWQENGEPKPITRDVIETLEGVLEQAPEHPMANHLLIHAVEAVQPEKGMDAARRLEDLVPGAGHLVHMPSHIYIRTGRYHAATRQNLRAIEADHRYLEQVEETGVYPIGYVPHNYHFGWATATLEGGSGLALRLAREMSQMVDKEAMRQRPLTTLQHYWITPVYALTRFGRWDEILEYEQPAEDLVYPRAVWRYARGMARAREGELDAARSELEHLDELRDDESLKWVTVWDINKSRHILEIASHALRGEIASEAGDYPTAIEALEQAVEREDALNYDEPPTWHYPVRQSLGAVLLQAGQPKRAEAVYRKDLEKFPDNGWSLFGLAKALEAQGKEEQAQDMEKRFREAWRHADIELTASRF
jgi:tetratricopeptide (TPR) repeat protein